MPLLAQIDPGTAETWLKVLFWLAGGCFLLVKLYKELSGRSSVPNPLSVSKHAKFVLEEELTQVHGRIKREREEIDRAIAVLHAEDLRLREKLDEEINDLQDRVDKIPGRVITLLRETKGLI